MTNAIAMIVALTIYHEAAGEPWAGKIAVASVIHNRAHGDPALVAAVCRRPKQFSCWNGRTALPEPRTDARSQLAWRECQAIGRAIEAGYFTPSTDADHYHARRITPAWSKSMSKRATIGRHVFYRRD